MYANILLIYNKHLTEIVIIGNDIVINIINTFIYIYYYDRSYINYLYIIHIILVIWLYNLKK